MRGAVAGVAALVASSFLVVAPAGAMTRGTYDMPVSTFAGGLGGGPATNLSISPNAIAVVGDTLYIAEQADFRKVDLTTGISSLIATNPWNLYAPADPTVLHGACAIAPAPDGTLYVGEPGKVVHLDAQYRPTDVALVSGENPCALAVEANGDVLMSGNGMLLYRIDPGAGTVTAIWPTMNGAGFSVFNPVAIATMPNGDFLIAENNGRVMRSTPQGDMTVFAGTGTYTDRGDGGPAIDADVHATGLAVAADGSVYVAEGTRVRRIDTDGIITTVAGDDNYAIGNDGSPPTETEFGGLKGISLDAEGVPVVAENGSGRVRRLGETVETLAGRYGSSSCGGGDGGPAIDAQFGQPLELAGAPDGSILVSDTGARCIRRIDPSGTVSTYALAAGGHMIVAPDGTVVLGGGNLLESISPGGARTVLAGVPGISGGFAPGGLATLTVLDTVTALTFDPQGRIVFATGATIARLDTDGYLRQIAGNGFPTTGGDGGPAFAAKVSVVRGMAYDAMGRLVIADGTRIRRIDLSGTITTVATLTEAAGPLSFDGAGNLYFISAGHSVKRMSPLGVVTDVTAAATANPNPSPDGTLASKALFVQYYGLNGLLITRDGRVLVSDSLGRIREVALAVGFSSSSPNPAYVGQAVTFVAAPTSPTASGSMSFYDGTTLLGTRTVVGGLASLSTWKLGLGAHDITATFTQKGSTAPVQVLSVTQQIVAAPTNITVAAPWLVLAGHSAVFRVRVNRVSPASGRVSGGTVTFFDNGVPLATVAATFGRVYYASRLVTRGTHQITASFSGSASDLTSTSAPSTLTAM
jgi:streptogramin lyase